MIRALTSFLSFVAFLAGISSFAQKANKQDQYRAVHWTTEEGLNNNFMNVMLKDSKGFLWIGNLTGELIRFDGARFKTFIPDTKKQGAINAGQVTWLVEDSLNNIWVSTARGLSRFDMQTEVFKNFTATIDSTAGDQSLIPFWSTKTHVYCFESRIRIVAFDIQSLEKKTIVALKEPIKNFNNSYVLMYAILDTASNSVWILHPSSEEGANGLVQISLTGGTLTKYPWPVIYPGRVRKDAESMKLDRKRNSIWINTPYGLFEFSLKSKQFRAIDVLSEITKSKEYERYVGIDIDKDGKIWFATKPLGILIYDPETNQVNKLFSNRKLQKEIAERNHQLYIDREGIIWTSYYLPKGIYQLLPYSPSVKSFSSGSNSNSLSHSTVTTIVPGPHGKMWVGTLDGLNIFDPVTEKFEILREKDFKGVKGKVFAPLFVDSTRQTAWISVGTHLNYWNMNLYEVDLKSMKAYRISFHDGSKQLDTLIYDPTYVKLYRGSFMIADDRYGVFELKPGSRKAQLLIPFASRKGRFVIGDGILFFHSGGGNRVNSTFKFTANGKWTEIPHHFDSLFWTNIHYDSLKRLYWVSLSHEIALYDENFTRIKTFRHSAGKNRRIMTSQVDQQGNLWYANDGGSIGRLNTSTGSLYFLSEADGYQGQHFDWPAPCCQDIKGNIYFGSGSSNGRISNDTIGFTRIKPRNYSSANNASVYFTNLKINDNEYPTNVSVDNLQELTIPYNKNNIIIDAGIIDYYTQGAGQLRYKLDGEDLQNNWSYIEPDQPIRLENLQPGSYKLIAQASSPGTEMMSPEKILSISMSSPYWKTWGFQILVAILLISVVYAIILFRSRSLKRQNVLLEEKITMRTNDLKHSLDELKATQAQLIQSEKMASLGQLTAGIAHEIQNPLNFVNNFSELSQELLDEMGEAIKKGNLNQATEISEDVKANLQKVLLHGKRADGIVKGMLQHSRSSSGIKEPTLINKLVDEYLRLAFHGLRAKNKTFSAAVETHFDNSVGSINVIPQDIGRAVLNLITNAFYAVTEKKKLLGDAYGPTVVVTTKKSNNKVEISVRDNGNGIPQSIIEKIFQPFFTTKPTGEGTGLGLSLCYDIITAHSGELKVDTKEGEWTNFRIILPAV
ncbi:MAG TPA: ATP-binding protein [Chryseolinea sp.]|nr:ATP-binding protein [Chryseolinea sp.]